MAVINDFAGFDRKHNLDLWKVWLKNVPEKEVFVFAGSWIEARRVAQSVHHESFDAFDGAPTTASATSFPIGTIVGFCERVNGKPTSNHRKFRVTAPMRADQINNEFLREL